MKSTPKYNYLIVGAGLFGSVFAHEATKRGKKCLVVERRSHIAGNCYTEDIQGIPVHKYGAHIFHTDKKYLWDYYTQFGPFHPFINSPIAITHGRAYNLPFNMNTFAQVFGVTRPSEVSTIINREAAKHNVAHREPRNLEEKALSMVGDTIYEMFIKNYTEKQWGKPCTELPMETINRIPVRLTYNNNYFDDPYQGIPDNGYTSLFEKMLEGVEVKLNTPYTREMEGLAERVIYTGMIDEYFNYQFGALEYRSLKFVDVIKDVPNWQGNAVMNYPDPDYGYIRSIEHKHFYPSLITPTTVVSYEFSVNYMPGLTAFYPVKTKRNQDIYTKYVELAEKSNVLFKGRLGSFRYFDMDDTIEHSLALVKELLP